MPQRWVNWSTQNRPPNRVEADDHSAGGSLCRVQLIAGPDGHRKAGTVYIPSQERDYNLPRLHRRNGRAKQSQSWRVRQGCEGKNVTSGNVVCEVHGRSEDCPKYSQVYSNCQGCDEAVCTIHSLPAGSRVDMGSIVGLAPARPTDQAGYALYGSLVQRKRLPKSHGDKLSFP